MPITAINVAAILVIVLPGFLAYRFAVWRSTDPTQRSPLWQMSEILEHSVYVHLIGVGLVALVVVLLNRAFGVTTHIPELLQGSPDDFLKSHFAEAVLWFTLYPVYVIISSPIFGAYNVPRRFSVSIVKVLNWSSATRWLRWIPAPEHAFPQEPVWYYAFNRMSDNYRSKLPHVYVTLKSGDVYYGALVTYLIVSDTEIQKDFLIKDACYLEGGKADLRHNLYEVDGIGAVLLNSANVDSIILYYADVSTEESE